MKKKVTLARHTEVLVKDIAYIQTDDASKKKEIEQVTLHELKKRDGHYVVIDGFLLLAVLQKNIPQFDGEIIGLTETIIEVESKTARPNILFILFIWTVLFIGTAVTIMNFH